MAVNPYSFKDQYKPEWQAIQQQIAGTYTRGTRFDPKPVSTSTNWTPASPNFSASSGSVGPLVGSGSSRGGSSGPGLVATVIDGVAELTDWMVDRLLPLRLGRQLGAWCHARGWRIRLPLACIGAAIGVGLAGDYSPLVIAGVGAAAGWALPTIVAALVLMAVYLVGLAAAVSAIAVGLAAAYSVAAWFLAWPSLASWFGG